MKGICCICNGEVESVYAYVKHLDGGKSRIYEGHKRCLFAVESKLSEGEKLEFTEYERSRK